MCVCGKQLQSFRDKMAGTFDVAVRRVMRERSPLRGGCEHQPAFVV